jgi:hypothetical protein
VPRTKGGTDEDDNLQTLCGPCNSRKGNRLRQQRHRDNGRNAQGALLDRDAETDGSRGVTPPETDTENRTHVAPTPAELAADFGAWWEGYPRKVGRITAETAYRKARKHQSAPDLLAGRDRSIAAWKAEGREDRLIPHPTTWLNQGRWADEYATNGHAPLEEVPDTWR